MINHIVQNSYSSSVVYCKYCEDNALMWTKPSKLRIKRQNAALLSVSHDVTDVTTHISPIYMGIRVCHLQFFWYLCCFRQGFICATLRNKKNIGLIWFMSISSSDFWLLCCTITHYNYKGKMAKISPKIHKIEIWPKSRPKVINSPNKSHRDHIWGMFEL